MSFISFWTFWVIISSHRVFLASRLPFLLGTPIPRMLGLRLESLRSLLLLSDSPSFLCALVQVPSFDLASSSWIFPCVAHHLLLNPSLEFSISLTLFFSSEISVWFFVIGFHSLMRISFFHHFLEHIHYCFKLHIWYFQYFHQMGVCFYWLCFSLIFDHMLCLFICKSLLSWKLHI